MVVTVGDWGIAVGGNRRRRCGGCGKVMADDIITRRRVTDGRFQLLGMGFWWAGPI